jgi:branched-chain amino acid:cation transporter, LIVCS family
MRSSILSRVFRTSLTIFAMLFGAGNLMFPLRVGMEGGTQSLYGFLGFLATGVILPLLGLLAIVGFNGDYRAFFYRLGTIPGFLAILFCMLVIGPVIVMPRIVALSYEMLSPFMPPAISIGLFSVIFLSLVYGATYRPGKLLTIIGTILSPLKVATLATIMTIGFFAPGFAVAPAVLPLQLFIAGGEYGYQTLDLFGTIFFGSIIVSLLTKYSDGGRSSIREAVKISALSGVFAAILLAAVYGGMTLLGAYHGHGLEHLNEGAIFSAVTRQVLGHYGGALIAATIFLACFTTTVSLSAVLTEYVRYDLMNNRISYQNALLLVLVLTGIIARNGLGVILSVSIPVVVASYPVLIALTVCNILYLAGVLRAVKIPVAIVLCAVIVRLVFGF